MTTKKSQFKHYTGHPHRSLQTPALDPQEKTHVFYGTTQAAVCNTTLRQQSLQTPNFIS